MTWTSLNDYFYGKVATINQKMIDSFMGDKTIPNGAFFKMASDAANIQHTFIVVKIKPTKIGVIDVNGEHCLQYGFPTGELIKKLKGYKILIMGDRPSNLDRLVNNGLTHLCLKHADMLIKRFKKTGIHEHIGETPIVYR